MDIFGEDFDGDLFANDPELIEQVLNSEAFTASIENNPKLTGNVDETYESANLFLENLERTNTGTDPDSRLMTDLEEYRGDSSTLPDLPDLDFDMAQFADEDEDIEVVETTSGTQRRKRPKAQEGQVTTKRYRRRVVEPIVSEDGYPQPPPQTSNLEEQWYKRKGTPREHLVPVEFPEVIRTLKKPETEIVNRRIPKDSRSYNKVMDMSNTESNAAKKDDYTRFLFAEYRLSVNITDMTEEEIREGYETYLLDNGLEENVNKVESKALSEARIEKMTDDVQTYGLFKPIVRNEDGEDVPNAALRDVLAIPGTKAFHDFLHSISDRITPREDDFLRYKRRRVKNNVASHKCTESKKETVVKKATKRTNKTT